MTIYNIIYNICQYCWYKYAFFDDVFQIGGFDVAYEHGHNLGVHAVIIEIIEDND